MKTMKTQYLRLLCGALLCTSACAAAWAAPGSMVKDDVLRQNATPSAASVGSVAKGTLVEILARQGGWTQVRHAGKTGWVRILSVKTHVDNTNNHVTGIIQMGSAQRDPSRVVAVAGLRGLNEDELRSARFNASELLRMNQFVSSRADAERFARNAGLRPLEVAYIEPPKSAAPTTLPSGGFFSND